MHVSQPWLQLSFVSCCSSLSTSSPSKFISLALKLKFNYLLRPEALAERKGSLEEGNLMKAFCFVGRHDLQMRPLYRPTRNENNFNHPALTLLLFSHARQIFTVPQTKTLETFSPPRRSSRREKLD